ncbi:hypothetical protein BGZ79_000211 [Entomortierella chlamydospora]|nr:hypothetical protein BGZ79_000211 [Entomortierella chlamydospora]
MQEIEFDLGTRISRGGQVDIFLGKYGIEKVAIKKYFRPNHRTTANEIQVINELRHRHIVQYYHLHDDMLVMEYLKGGSLTKAIPSLEWRSKTRIARQVALGLAYLHSKNIIHCDLKSSNILLTENLDAKICDFGPANGNGGTLPWMAPERLQDPPQSSTKSDIYSLGVVMWEMASGRTPYEELTPDRMASLILEGITEIIPEGTPEEYATEIKRCWKPVDERPVAIDVFQGYTDTEQEKGKKDEGEENEGEDENMMYLQRSAKCGDAPAMHQLGLVYFNGLDVPQDYVKARDWFEKAAMMGYTDGCMNLATMYHKGIGIPENLTEAIRWYKVAANQGSMISQSQLGNMYYRGDGTAVNYEEAVKWHQMAADQSFLPSVGVLVTCYGLGRGVSRDPAKAVELALKFAELGFPEVQFLVGTMYTDNYLTPKDDEKAKSGFKRQQIRDTQEPSRRFGNWKIRNATNCPSSSAKLLKNRYHGHMEGMY